MSVLKQILETEFDQDKLMIEVDDDNVETIELDFTSGVVSYFNKNEITKNSLIYEIIKNNISILFNGQYFKLSKVKVTKNLYVVILEEEDKTSFEFSIIIKHDNEILIKHITNYPFSRLSFALISDNIINVRFSTTPDNSIQYSIEF